MKRKVSDVPCRIWTFGVQPTPDKELFDDQLIKAHRYYNMLIEIERWRRTEFRKARSRVADMAPLEARHEALKAEIQTLRTSIKARRAASRTREAAPDLQPRLKEAQAERKAVYAELKAARLALRDDPVLKEATEKLAAEGTARVKAARAACGVYWGTYLLTEKAAESAAKSPTDPEFRRWRGEGRVGVQLHHEKFQDVLEGKSTMLRITLNAPRGTSRRAEKRRFGTVQLRVGSATPRDPIWVSFPVILHRLPPPGATLTWAWVRAQRIGTQIRYELQITVESAEFADGPRGHGVAAIDVGWRVLPNGDLRVAYLRDDQGTERELCLPAKLLSRLRFCQELRSYQSLHFDVALAHWRSWVEAFDDELPEWLREVRPHLALWKSPARLAHAVARWIDEAGAREEVDRLWDLWRAARLEQKLDLFATLDEVAEFFKDKTDLYPTMVYMELWRRKNHHLRDWEAHQRAKCLGWRKDIYRNFAADVAKTYQTVVFEDIDLRKLNRNAQPEEETRDHLHWSRNTAAPGELRGFCVSAMGKSRVVEEETVDSTRECHACHHVNTWPEKERAQRVLTCQGCGMRWDQDSNAARVLLWRYFERFGAPESGGGARAGEMTQKAGLEAPANERRSTRDKDRSQTAAEAHGTTAP